MDHFRASPCPPYTKFDGFPACHPLWMLGQYCIRSLVLEQWQLKSRKSCSQINCHCWWLPAWEFNLHLLSQVQQVQRQPSQLCPALKQAQRCKSLLRLHLGSSGNIRKASKSFPNTDWAVQSLYCSKCLKRWVWIAWIEDFLKIFYNKFGREYTQAALRQWK